MRTADRLVVALDRSSPEEVRALVDELSGAVGVFKLGLQAFVASGPDLVREVVGRGERVFLDLKLHDIPNTVARAVAEAARLGAAMLTLHAAGGEAMMRAAAEAAEGRLTLLGVTVLTSLDEHELEQVGLRGTAAEAAVRLARLAERAGLDGVVASPLEIEPIRRACGSGLTIVTPGIRSAGDAAGDQSRTRSAREAVRLGADYIVVGRPITEAARPRAAAEAIVRSLEE